MDASGNVTYKDYAYESTAGKAIKTGVESSSNVGLPTITNENSFTFYSNPASNNVTFITSNHVTSIKWINSLGANVLEIPINETNTSVSVLHLPTGIYFVETYNGRLKLAAKKLIIQ